MRPTDRQWQAIQENDRQQDGQFWYGVKTTGIFCRPSCPSRVPKRQNVVIFTDPAEAQEAGFRPCKRCRPLEKMVSNQIWVQEINHVLNNHYAEKLTLERLATLVHGSPSYLRHVYKSLTGVTPQQQLTMIRLEKATQQLRGSSKSVAQIAFAVGINNAAYFTQMFKNTYKMTPLQYRHQTSKEA